MFWKTGQGCNAALTRSSSCALPFPPSICLSLPLPHIRTHMPPTVRSVYDVCLPFLLNHYTIHWRAPTRHLFSESEWITFQYCLTIKGVQVFKQTPFMLPESFVTLPSASMPLQSQMAFKRSWTVCLCACVYVHTDRGSITGIWGLNLQLH